MQPLWSADPLNGVVVWGSLGIVAWSIIAAFVGTWLGTLRQMGRGRPRLLPTPPRRMRQRPLRSSVAMSASAVPIR